VDKVAKEGLTIENVSSCQHNLNAAIAICASEKAAE